MDRQKAFETLALMTNEDISKWVVKRATGEDVQKFSSMGDTEFPEDIIVDLLCASETEPRIRTGIISGCKALFAMVVKHLMSEARDAYVLENYICVLCTIVERSNSKSLASIPRALLDIMVEEQEVSADLCARVAACLLIAGVNASQRDLWVSLLDRESSAPYALRALIDIQLHSEATIRAFVEIWLRKLNDGWQVDPIAQLFYVERKYGSAMAASLLEKVFQRIESIEVRNTVKLEIQNDNLVSHLMAIVDDKSAEHFENVIELLDKTARSKHSVSIISSRSDTNVWAPPSPRIKVFEYRNEKQFLLSGIEFRVHKFDQQSMAEYEKRRDALINDLLHEMPSIIRDNDSPETRRQLYA